MSGRLRAAIAAAAAVFALMLMLMPQIAQARGDGSETHIFSSIYVAPGEMVDGDVSVVFGDADVAGVVTGNCYAYFGSCRAVDDGVIQGGSFGIGDMGWGAHDIFERHELRLIARLATNAVVLLAFLLFPVRTRITLDRVEQHPGAAALTGVAAMVALLPLALILTLTVVGIPLIALEIAGFFGAIWVGTAAVALLIGRRLCELIAPHGTPSPLTALVVGLVVVSAAEIAPLIGWVVTALVWVVGLGGALLSLSRSARLEALLARAPIGGPPMTTRR